jgi:hypothetical protein
MQRITYTPPQYRRNIDPEQQRRLAYGGPNSRWNQEYPNVFSGGPSGISWNDEAPVWQLPNNFGRYKFAEYLKHGMAAQFPSLLQKAWFAQKYMPYIRSLMTETLTGRQRDITVMRNATMGQARLAGQMQADMARAQGLGAGFTAGIMGSQLNKGAALASQNEVGMRFGQARMEALGGLAGVMGALDPNLDPAHVFQAFVSDPRRARQGGLGAALGGVLGGLAGNPGIFGR